MVQVTILVILNLCVESCYVKVEELCNLVPDHVTCQYNQM